MRVVLAWLRLPATPFSFSHIHDLTTQSTIFLQDLHSHAIPVPTPPHILERLH
jgi:hypothetical protein